MESEITNSEIYDFIKKAGGIERVISLYNISEVLECFDTTDVVQSYPVDDVLDSLGSDNYNYLIENISIDTFLDRANKYNVIFHYGEYNVIKLIQEYIGRKDFLKLISNFITDEEAAKEFNTLDYISINEFTSYFKEQYTEILNNIEIHKIRDYIYFYEKYNKKGDVKFEKTIIGQILVEDVQINDILEIYDIKALIQADCENYLYAYNNNLVLSNDGYSPIALFSYLQYLCEILYSINKSAIVNFSELLVFDSSIIMNEFNSLENEYKTTLNNLRLTMSNYFDLYSEIYTDVALKFDINTIKNFNQVLVDSENSEIKLHLFSCNKEEKTKVKDTILFDHIDQLLESLELE